MTDDPQAKELSREEIATATGHHEGVARILLDQGNIAVQDLLDTKKQYESKAVALLTAFIQISIAEIGATFIAQDQIAYEYAFIGSGVLFAFAAFACAWSLREMRYGSPGVDPRRWLRPRHLFDDPGGGEPKGSMHKAARLMATIAHDLGGQLDYCAKSNKRKEQLVSAAIFLGVGGLVVTLVAGFAEVFGPKP